MTKKRSTEAALVPQLCSAGTAWPVEICAQGTSAARLQAQPVPHVSCWASFGTVLGPPLLLGSLEPATMTQPLMSCQNWPQVPKSSPQRWGSWGQPLPLTGEEARSHGWQEGVKAADESTENEFTVVLVPVQPPL